MFYASACPQYHGAIGFESSAQVSTACESATPISQGGRLQVPGLAIHALWIPPFQHASGTGWSGPESVKCRVHSKTGDGQYLQRAVFFTMKSTSAISSLKTTASAIANAKHWRGFADIKFVIHLH